MRKRRTIWILTGCALAALIAALAFSIRREPQYGGRNLREWLQLYSPERFRVFPNGGGQEAAEAVRQIGTNALPWLLKWTDYQPPDWKITLLNKAPDAAHGWVLGRGRLEELRLGMSGFEILGPQGKPALPELQRRMTDWEKPWRASLAMESYSQIKGADSVPALVAALASTNADCRRTAIRCLASLGTHAAPAVPALQNALNDSDPVVRSFASKALPKVLQQTPGVDPGQTQ